MSVINRPSTSIPTTPATGTSDVAASASPSPVVTTPLPPAGRTGPSDTFAPGGSTGGGLVGRAREEIRAFGWDELRSGVNIGTSTNVSGFRLGVRLSETVHTALDPEVANDPIRSVATAALKLQSGKEVVWAESAGALEAGPDLSTSLPVSGVMNVHVGFSQTGLLRYRSVVPRTLDNGSMSDVFKKDNLKLPLSAQGARSLVPGTTIEVTGQGTRAVSGGVSAGHTVGGGGSSGMGGAFSAGLTHARTQVGTFGVEVTRLDGDKVRVTLREVNEQRRDTNMRLRAGLTLTPGESLTDAVGRRGADVLADAVDAFAIDVRAGKQHKEIGSVSEAFELDLANPQAAQVYSDLLKLNTTAASGLATQSGSGVTQVTTTASTVQDSTDASVRFLGKKLVLFNALRAEEAVHTQPAGGAARLVRTSRYSRTYTGLLSGKKAIEWEGVNATGAGVTSSGASANFFHMKFSNDDKITRDKELKKFVTFAEALGIEGADVRNIITPGNSWVSRFFSSRDDTKVNADIYFTDEGVRQIVASDQPSVRSAMVWAQAQFHTDYIGLPINDPTAKAIAKEYAKLEKEGRFADGQEQQGIDADQRRLARQYRDTFGHGRKLRDDVKVFNAAESFGQNVLNMGQSGTEAGWTSLFADLGQSEKFDYMPTMLAMQRLASPEQTLVHELSLVNKDMTLRAKDEGKLEMPG